MGFDEDLILGEKFELAVVKKIQTKYPKAYKIKGYNKEADIMIPETNKQIECKLDLKSRKTGNVAIEYAHRGKSSGIEVTESEWWALGFYHKDEFLWALVEIEKLKMMVSLVTKTFGGDGDVSSLYLIPTDEIVYTFRCKKFTK